ncbi:MAG: response regulator transcription factor [Bdellovibrionales bacterium]
MNKFRALLVEDEPDIAELIKFNLSLEGFDVEVAGSSEQALKYLENNMVDVLLLDVMLPGMDGIEFCKLVRKTEKLQDLPVLVLTAKNQESDLVSALESGADDFISKPFSPAVLVARVKSVLRRSKGVGASEINLIQYQDLEIHRGKHSVKVEQREVSLTQSEYQILELLASKPGWVFTRGQIVDAIRGENYAVTERAIDFQMVGLRKKMGSCGNYIETIRGVGYRFQEQ